MFHNVLLMKLETFSPSCSFNREAITSHPLGLKQDFHIVMVNSSQMFQHRDDLGVMSVQYQTHLHSRLHYPNKDSVNQSIHSHFNLVLCRGPTCIHLSILKKKKKNIPPVLVYSPWYSQLSH